MRIAVHSPFGAFGQEVGVIYLLASYLKELPADVKQLTCNGVFSLCDRDGESSWKRSVRSCLACMSDQNQLARWSGIPEDSLSRFLRPEDIETTKRWVGDLSVDELSEARFNEVPIGELAFGSFAGRFGVKAMDPRNKSHVPVMRRFLMSAARMSIASQRFLDEERPSITFVAGGRDYISRTYAYQANEADVSVVLFQWKLHDRKIHIVHPRRPEVMSCDLLLEGLVSMRPEINTWSPDLIGVLSDILNFLDIADSQLALPIAQ